MDKFRTEVRNSKDTPVPFTISIGVAGYEGDYSDTLIRADKALYKAKNTGKDKVVVQ